MATGKKSFLLYCDIIHTIEKMDDTTAGEFFKHYLRYINDLNPKTDNLIVDIAFESVKQNLKRDLKKWEGTKDAKSISGQEGNLKRWHPDIYQDYKDGKQTLKESQNIAKGRTAIKPIANIAVKDTVTVTDTVKDTVTVKVKDKVINKNTLDKRKLKFAESLEIYLDTFGKDLLNNFFHYWTEHNEDGKKMRFEYAKSQPFNVKRRLTSWQSRNIENANFKGNKKRGEGVDAEYMNELKTRLYGNK